MSHIQVVQEIGMTGMLQTGIGGRFIQYFAKKIGVSSDTIRFMKRSTYSPQAFVPKIIIAITMMMLSSV